MISSTNLALLFVLFAVIVGLLICAIGRARQIPGLRRRRDEPDYGGPERRTPRQARRTDIDENQPD